jgi:DNA polymerase I
MRGSGGLGCVAKPRHALTGRRRIDIERLTDRLNAPVQGTGADGLKLSLALLWEHRDECAEATPVLVCYDEIVVECDENQGEETRRWLEKATIDGMDAVINGAGNEPVLVEARVLKNWGEGG